MYTDFALRERVLDALRPEQLHGFERFFSRAEAIAWRVTGLSWSSIVRYGPNIGPDAVLRALERGIPSDYTDELHAAGIDEELAIWWFATGVDAGEAIRRSADGDGPHQVRPTPLQAAATLAVTSPAVTEEQP